MARYIEPGSSIVLTSSGQKTEFIIDEVVGLGGSCIAYRVSYIEGSDIQHKGILKEFCPAFLSEESEFYRTGSDIIVPAGAKDAFAAELENFKETYKRINEYLSGNTSAANYHTVQIGLYEGNNTAYTLTAADYGQSYDKTDDEDLASMIRVTLAVTKAVEMYHRAGYLHLDIKPKNILVLDGVRDLVKLFDFDSLTPIEALKARSVKAVPVPEDYYVPELSNCDIRNIGIHTDIFEIGAMLFSRLFKRAPLPEEMTRDAVLNFDGVKLAVGLSPKAKHELEVLFKNTVQISKRSRFSSTEELKAQLEKILSIIDGKAPYVVDMPRWRPSERSVGRTEELREIKRRLDTDGYVFVKGIGGLGKSELVKLFAEKYSREYHTVQFCKYENSLKNLVASIAIDGIRDDDYKDFDALVSEKNKVLHLSDDHTLIIVDNFNVGYDEFTREFLPSSDAGFKVIFTTRFAQDADYYASKTYNLPHLSTEDCEALFKLHCPEAENSDKEILDRLITAADYNTLVLILMASTVRKTSISLEEMLEKLDDQRLDELSANIFHEYDYSTEETKAYNRLLSHLNAIFSVRGLSDAEKEIMKNMTLVPSSGVCIGEFIKYCSSKNINKDSISKLVKESWINLSGETIYVHPIVSDLVAWNDSITKAESYYNLAENLEELCNPDYLIHISHLLNRLSLALQLDRRYVSEGADKRALIKSKVGRMYANTYRPIEAREYFTRALEIAESEKVGYYLPYLYYFLGNLEKDFGTKTKAVNYFERSYKLGCSLKLRYYQIALESRINIAECYGENRENEKAFDEYKKALKFAKLHFFREYIYDIAIGLAKICEDMEWQKDAEKYRALAEKNKKYALEDETPEELDRIEEKVADGDLRGIQLEYESFLSKYRDKLGEDSPIYKDAAQSRWAYFIINGDKEQGLRLMAENLSFFESSFGADSMEMASQLVSVSGILPLAGEFEYALNAARRAMTICEKNGEIHSYTYFESKLSIAECYLIMGKKEEAAACISDVDFSEFSGGDALSDVVGSAGVILCEVSRYDEAEKLCLSLLQRKNVSRFSLFQANMILSIASEQRGDQKLAEKYVEAAGENISDIPESVQKNGWLVQYHRARARILYRKGDYSAAVREIDECLASLREEDLSDLDLCTVYTERGMYHFLSGRADLSEADYKEAERILRVNNCPKERYCLLYNNVSLNYTNTAQYEKAYEYLRRIVELTPGVEHPKSFFDAIVCGNLGWAAFNLGQKEYPVEMLKRAIKCYETIGAARTKEYVTLESNLALVLLDDKKWDEAAEIYNNIYSQYEYISDPTCELRRIVCCNYIRCLLESSHEKEAYELAQNEVVFFAGKLGDDSLEYAGTLDAIGRVFSSHGFLECMEFFEKAEDAVNKGCHFNSTVNARIENSIGVCFADLKGDAFRAFRRFQYAKDTLDEIGAASDPLYQIVEQNIEYANKIMTDSIVRDLAERMKNNSQGDEDGE